MNFSVRGAFAPAALLCLCAVSVSGRAQDCSKGISVLVYGDVTDPAKAAVGQVTVVLQCGAQQQTATTDKAGHYSLRVPAGNWRASILASGFGEVHRSVVITGPEQKVDFALSVASATTQVEVHAGAEGYTATESMVGTRTETRLLEVPQSAYVIPAAVLQDQQVQRLTDATRNVSGISFGNDAGGRYESLVIRGFTSGALFKDGFRNDSASNLTFTEMSNVENVEVLKGPSSTVFGRLDPSGVVNLVTKQPLPFSQDSVQMQGGSFQYLAPVVDVTGPLTHSGRLLGRLIVSGQDSKSFRDFNVQHRLFMAPSVTWTPSAKTNVRFYTEFLGGSGMTDRGLIALGTRPANLPLSRYLADSSLQYPYRQGKGGVMVDQMLPKGWMFRSYERSSTGFGMYNARIANSLQPDNVTVKLNDLTSEQYFQTHYWINEATGKFTTGWVKHTALVGSEIDYELFDTKTARATTASAAKELLNIYTPNYAALPKRELVVSRIDQSHNGYGGVYVQDQAHLGDKLVLTAGMRWDNAKLKDVGYLGQASTSSRQTAWSPRAGLSYLPMHNLAFYATWSRSFQPQSGTDAQGNLFQPERGKLLEAGVKFDALQRRVNGTISVYQVDRTNVLTTDPNNTAYSIQVGAQRSRGVEWNQTTRLTGGWNLIQGYSFNQAQVSKDNVYLVGSGLLAAPQHTGNTWLQYRPQNGVLRGASFGAGIFGASKSEGQLRTQAAPNTYFLLPGYARFDLGGSYDLPSRGGLNYRLAVNANNVLDRRYFAGSGGRFAVYPGMPRNLIFSLKITHKGESR